MNSRMEKYYQTNDDLPKRTDKNALLYKEVSKNEIDKFKLNSNISVLENNNTSINIDELKGILDKKYTNPPQRKSIFIETKEETPDEVQETTKEYDINAILEKAREEKEEDYEADRFKKVTETQFDILKSLTIDSEPKIEKLSKSPEEEELMTLINTISAKELGKAMEINPLDILSDLKGGENTEVIEAMSSSITESGDKVTVDTSFYTNSVGLTKEDLEEYDVDDTSNNKKSFVWFIIVIAILAFLVGVVIIVNKYFNLGLF